MSSLELRERGAVHDKQNKKLNQTKKLDSTNEELNPHPNLF
jgi:hypothetical protein